jgi:hypothetical protein
LPLSQQRNLSRRSRSPTFASRQRRVLTSFGRSGGSGSLSRRSRSFTVSVVAAYFARRENEGAQSLGVLPRLKGISALRDVPVADVRRDMLSQWLAGLAGKAQDEQDAEAVRHSTGRAQIVSWPSCAPR